MHKHVRKQIDNNVGASFIMPPMYTVLLFVCFFYIVGFVLPVEEERCSIGQSNVSVLHIVRLSRC